MEKNRPNKRQRNVLGCFYVSHKLGAYQRNVSYQLVPNLFHSISTVSPLLFFRGFISILPLSFERRVYSFLFWMVSSFTPRPPTYVLCRSLGTSAYHYLIDRCRRLTWKTSCILSCAWDWKCSRGVSRLPLKKWWLPLFLFFFLSFLSSGKCIRMESTFTIHHPNPSFVAHSQKRAHQDPTASKPSRSFLWALYMNFTLATGKTKMREL